MLQAALEIKFADRIDETMETWMENHSYSPLKSTDWTKNGCKLTTHFFLLLSSTVSGILFFCDVDFDRELTGEDGRSSRCLRRGERERERLLRFLLGERDLLLLRCLRFSLSLSGIVALLSGKITQRSFLTNFSFFHLSRSNGVARTYF